MEIKKLPHKINCEGSFKFILRFIFVLNLASNPHLLSVVFRDLY